MNLVERKELLLLLREWEASAKTTQKKRFMRWVMKEEHKFGRRLKEGKREGLPHKGNSIDRGTETWIAWHIQGLYDSCIYSSQE